MRNRLKNLNFFLTSLAIWSSIDNLVDSGTFIVKDTTVNGSALVTGTQLLYVILDADQTLKREIFRITHVDTATKIFTFDKRISPNGKQAHAENALVQINDFAELFNYFAAQLDDGGATEVVTGRDVKINGGIFRFSTSNLTLADTTLTVNPNTTNYIILNFGTNTFQVVTTLPAQYYLLATAVANGTDVTTLTDTRAQFIGVDTSSLIATLGTNTPTTLTGILKWNGSLLSGDSSLNDVAMPTADFSMNNKKFTNLADWTLSGDAVNYWQLQASIWWLLPQDPVATPNVINDQLSAQPWTTVVWEAYLVWPTATWAVWTGKEGRIMQALDTTGTTWVDVLGRVVAIGDRLWLSLEHGTVAGGFVGKNDNLAQITNATPGSYTYTFTAPLNTYTVAISWAYSPDLWHGYYYNGTDAAWVEFITGSVWSSVSDPWVQQSYADIITIVSGATVAYNDGASTITITNPVSLQSDKLVFRTTGMEYQDSAGNILSFVTYSWVYSAVGSRSMTYSGIVVDGTTWTQTITGGRGIYQNTINNFYSTDVFRGDVIFKRSPSFPYFDTTPSGTVCTFDANNGGKQKITISTAWVYTLNFSNLKYGANYEFAIVCNHSSGTVTLNKWTITSSGSVTQYYTVWGTTSVTYPMTLTNWVHLFVGDVFTSAIHVVYSGKSVLF